MEGEPLFGADDGSSNIKRENRTDQFFGSLLFYQGVR